MKVRSDVPAPVVATVEAMGARIVTAHRQGDRWLLIIERDDRPWLAEADDHGFVHPPTIKGGRLA